MKDLIEHQERQSRCPVHGSAKNDYAQKAHDRRDQSRIRDPRQTSVATIS